MADDAQYKEHTPSFSRDAGSRQSIDELSLVSSVSLMLSWIDSRLAELEERIVKMEKPREYEKMEVLEASLDKERAKSDELCRVFGKLAAGQSAFERELKDLRSEITSLRQGLVRVSDADRDEEKARLEKLYRMYSGLAAGQTAFDREVKELKGEIAGLRQAPAPLEALPVTDQPHEHGHDAGPPAVADKSKGEAPEGDRDKGKSVLARLGGLMSRLSVGRGRNEKLALLISKGDHFVLAGDSGKAIQEYQKALGLDPRSALAMTKLGKAYLARQELGKGLSALRSALEFDPCADDARIFLAGLLSHSNQCQKALDELARLAHPENYQLDIIKANALLGMKRYHEVIDLLSKSADDGNGEAARRLLRKAHAALSRQQS